jgi:hypothetical protein
VAGVRTGWPDDRWRCPPQGTVRLRGRADLRVPVGRPGRTPAGAPGRPQEPLGPPDALAGEALVVSSGGVPAATWEQDLAFPALVAVLSSPRRPMPIRVMGLWPDAGEVRTVEIDARSLRSAGRAVVTAVSALADHEAAADRWLDYRGAGSADAALPGTNMARAALASGFPAAVRGMSSTTRS